MKRRIFAIMMITTVALGLCACNQKEDTLSSAPTEIDTSFIKDGNTDNDKASSSQTISQDASDDVTEVLPTDSENGNSEVGSKEEIKEEPEHMETDMSVTYVPVDPEAEWSVTIQYSPDNAEVLCVCPPAVMISGFYHSGKVSGTADVCAAFDMGPGADGSSEELVMEAHINGSHLTLTVYNPDMPEEVKYWAKEMKFVKE